MATYSKSFSNNSKYTLILTVTEVTDSKGNVIVDVANNTNDVDWELKMTSGSASFGSWYVDSSVELDGEEVFSDSVKTSLSANSTLILGSGRQPIKHDDNGKKTMSCSASASTATDYSYLPGSASVSGDLTLTTIPRKSEVTCPSFNAGDSTNIVISKKDSSFTSTIRYIFGDLSDTIVNKTKETVVGWTPNADDFYAQFPDAKQKSGTIYCDTYSGSTLIGTSETSFTCYAKESDCIPDVSLVVKDVNFATTALTNDENVIIKGVSNAQLLVDYKTKNSATLKSIVANCGDGQKTKSLNGTLYAVNSGVFRATITDSRDFSKTVTVEKPIENGLLIDYVKLAITNVEIGRPETTSNIIKANIKGNYFNGNFSTEKTNSLKLTYRYRETGGEWSSQPVEELKTTLNVTEIEEMMGGQMTFELTGGTNDGETYSGTIPGDNIPDWIKTETDVEGNLIAKVYIYKTGDYTELTTVISGNSFTFNGELGSNFDYKKQYEFEFYAEDELMYVSASDKPIIVTKGISIIRVGDGYVDIRGEVKKDGASLLSGRISPTEPTTGEEVWIQKGKNLFNKNNVTAGYRLDSGGLPYTESTYSISEFIKVNSSENYAANWSVSIMECICYYDENKIFISRNTNTNPFVTPSNCKYIRFSRISSSLDTTQLEAGNAATTYEEYVDKKIYTKNDNGVYEEYINVTTLNDLIPQKIELTFNNEYVYSTDLQYRCFKIGKMVVLSIGTIAFCATPSTSTPIISGLPKAVGYHICYLFGGANASNTTFRCAVNTSGNLVAHYSKTINTDDSANYQYSGTIVYETTD